MLENWRKAPLSVLESHGREPLLIGGRQSRMNQGERVVTGQRVLQAQSDPFLGWIESWGEAGGEPTDFYLRQFRDMKGSIDLHDVDGSGVPGLRAAMRGGAGPGAFPESGCGRHRRISGTF